MPRITAFFALLCVLSGVLGTAPPAAFAAPPANWMWIWAKADAKTPDTVFFRQTFRLPAKPLAARLRIVADDQFLAYFNGQKKPAATGNDWTTVQEFDVTAALQKGDNLLAIEATNREGPGGLLYKLQITLPRKKTLTFFSDARVRANRRPPPGWTLPALDAAKWTSARELAPAGGGTWGTLRGAPLPDPTRLVRMWDIRAGSDASAAASPYHRTRNLGDRMLLSTSVASLSEMRTLAGAGFTLFQSDSDHLATDETAPNQWDWHSAEAQRRAARSLGLDWSYFPHYAFPPVWYRDKNEFTRLQCLEHHQPVAAFSIWEPKWGDFIGRGYDALAQQFKPAAKDAAPQIAAINVGVHGDYGEAGLLSGARLLVPAQREDWQKRFGDLHDHLGFWCDDPLARADFRAAMLKKYAALDALNAAWKRAYKTPEEITYPAAPRFEARAEWLDFINWYQESVGAAVTLNLAAARARFPETLLLLPAGFSDEDIRGGEDNSLIPKLAAKYGAAVRSTHSAFRPFAENAATMMGRLGSACRYYDVPFWTEPPSGLTETQETERLFEAVSQGAVGTFDWAENALAHRDVYYRCGKYLRVSKPIVDVAMYYPADAQKLRPGQPYNPLFAAACAALRDTCNYDIVDDRMVRDGALSRYRVLALWEGMFADAATLEKIKQWVADGGTLLAYDFGQATDFSGDLTWYHELFGYTQELLPARLTERYAGAVPTQYQIAPVAPESAEFLSGDWYAPEVVNGPLRWTGASASVRLPVDPERKATVLIRATVPPQAAGLKRRVLLNGHDLGALQSAGDVTYHFPIPAEFLGDGSLATLTIQSETFPESDQKEARPLGLLVQTVGLTQTDAPEVDAPPKLTGAIRRELDLAQLRTNWARRYGKGLTIYFPATKSLLRGYLEVIRQAAYHLSAIEDGRRNALPIDAAQDGVYATLFTDKILYYNSRDAAITKTVKIPAAAWEAWRGEVAIPAQTEWKLTLPPHSIEAIYLTPPPIEALFECEGFTDLAANPIRADGRCSPGVGPSCVYLKPGASITTRFNLLAPDTFAVYARAVRANVPQAAELLIDGQPFPAPPVLIGQTFRYGSLALAKGTHTLTIRAPKRQPALADFVLLTNDPTIRGYDFAVRNAPVE